MAQLQVKNYLERNKIGSLFEVLMARLIRDQPEDPLAYIRNTIQRKLEQRDGPQAAAPLSQTLPAAGAGAQRSGSISSESEKKRASSLSKTQPVQSAGAPRQSASSLSGKPASASSSTTNLDELFAATRSVKRDSKADASVSKSTPGPSGRPAAVQLDISEEALAKWAPQQAGPINIGYNGPARREKKPDEDELKVAKPAREKKQKEVTVDNLKELKTKQKAPEKSEKSSKAELAKMIADMEAEERATQAQLRALQAQAAKPHRDHADELSEDDEVLAKEGVTKKNDDGKKDKKKKKKDNKKENAQVRFAVCRLCARMLEPQDEAAGQPTGRVVWTGLPPASARNPLQDAAVNLPPQPNGAQTPVAPSTPSETRSQLEILQDLRLSLGLSSEDVATGRVSPYWKSLHSDVSDVEDGTGASARNSARPPSRPAAASRPGTASAPRRGPRSSQEFFNQ